MPYYEANNTLTHMHHIVPQHAEPFANNCPENLIELTVEDHAEMHKQLWLMNRDWEDEAAYLLLSSQIGKDELNRIIAEQNRGKKRPDHSEFMKGKTYGTGNKGKPKTEAHRQAMRDAKTPEMIAKQTAHFKGPRSEAHKAAIAAALTGKKKSPEHVEKMRLNALRQQQEKDVQTGRFKRVDNR